MRSIFDNHLVHVLARSPHYRAETLLSLAQDGSATLPTLARRIGLRSSRLENLLMGDGDDYARRDGLVPMGLVRRSMTPLGWLYELTDLGREAVEIVLRERARRTRRDEGA